MSRRTKQWLALALGIVVVLIYSSGALDEQLAPYGLNSRDCVELFGSYRCGDDLAETRDRLDKATDDVPESLKEKPDPAPVRVEVGEPANLKSGKTKLEVTVDRIAELPQDAAALGQSGTYFGMFATVKNTGRGTFSSYLDASLSAPGGRQIKEDNPFEGECSDSETIFSGTPVKVLPNETVKACLPFLAKGGEQPASAKITLPAQDTLQNDPEPTGVWSSAP